MQGGAKQRTEVSQATHRTNGSHGTGPCSHVNSFTTRSGILRNDKKRQQLTAPASHWHPQLFPLIPASPARSRRSHGSQLARFASRRWQPGTRPTPGTASLTSSLTVHSSLISLLPLPGVAPLWSSDSSSGSCGSLVLSVMEVVQQSGKKGSANLFGTSQVPVSPLRGPCAAVMAAC